MQYTCFSCNRKDFNAQAIFIVKYREIKMPKFHLTIVKGFFKKWKKIIDKWFTPHKGPNPNGNLRDSITTSVNDVDIIPYTRSVEAFVKLIQREVTLMQLILPEEFHSIVIEQIVSDILTDISDESAYFVQHLRNCKNRNRITEIPRGCSSGKNSRPKMVLVIA